MYQILYLEGPAGSGKSTIAKVLSERYLVVDRRFSNLRSKTPIQALGEHFLRLGEAFTLLSDYKNVEAVVIDRSPFSQYVYGRFREESDQFLSSFLPFYEAFERTGYGDIQVKFHFFFLIPPVEVLQKRRASSSKVYPYDGAEEIRLYWNLFRIMSHRFSCFLELGTSSPRRLLTLVQTYLQNQS